MSKFVNDSHILSEEGVNAFATYCNKHRPYIIWREETKNDFGVDGEVELTEKNQNGKLEATGYIVKIQIKSTQGSYIYRQDENHIEFAPTMDDIEYWNNHNLDVVIIIYYQENLYAKKVDPSEYVKSAKSKITIKFHKDDNKLVIGNNNFVDTFRKTFKNRISFDLKEKICSNLFKVKVPHYLFAYEASIEKPSDLKGVLTFSEQPEFSLRSKNIYTFSKLVNYKTFQENAIKSAKHEPIFIKNILNDKDKFKIISELLNKSFRNYCANLGVRFNKDYNRYYFVYTEKERKIPYRSKTGRSQVEGRLVASQYKYGKLTFVKHFAFETTWMIIDEDIYLILNPKYFFTTDGRSVLPNPSDVTKLTNYITSREYNQANLNHIHFIFDYLAKQKNEIFLLNADNDPIKITKYLSFDVPFGIPKDTEKKDYSSDQTQGTLF